MSECVNQIDIRELIIKELDRFKKYHDENYEFDYYEEKNPYGDTWATTSVEPTDASLEECDADFKDSFNVFDFIDDYLRESEEFRTYIENIVEKEF